jgi:hypothetical protein
MSLQRHSFRHIQSSISSRVPLMDDQIRNAVPSVFAAEAHDSRSERYAYIPTAEILAGLRREGFEVFSAMQARARSDDRREHTKHLVRLRHVGGRVLNVGDSVAEICLMNSHDGSSSYQMFAGLLRLVCQNGLMVPDAVLGSVKVPHSGKARDRVVEGAYEILDGYTRVIESRDDMQAVSLNEEEQSLFATAALALRYDDKVQAAPITATRLLDARRAADKGPDLWSTFNRVQENMIRGGLEARTPRGARTSTRAITGIDQNVRLNKALWLLADKMAELKRAN